MATSLRSRPLPGTGDWERLAGRQIELMIHGLGLTAPPANRHGRRSAAIPSAALRADARCGLDSFPYAGAVPAATSSSQGPSKPAAVS